MKRIVILLFVLFATGCEKTAQEVHQSSNPQVKVDLLFEHEGVRVYRFEDDYRLHYYAVPSSGVRVSSFSEWTESCGKNCTRVVTDEIPTLASR